MPPPDVMLATIRRAAVQSRGTPGRAGHLVHLQECDEVLVAGDLHGHLANFRVILEAAALTDYPRRHLVLQEVVHGEGRYPNGGDTSHQLLDLFSALKCQHPARVHLLPGNHELAQYTGRTIGRGEESQNQRFLDGVVEAYGDAAPEMVTAYNELMQSLPLALRTPNAVFLSHTLPNAQRMPLFQSRRLQEYKYSDADLQPGGFVYSLLWGRDTSNTNIDDYLRKVDADLLVSGHIPTEQGYLVPNHKQLIVDCASSPAAYVLFPATRPLTLQELVAGVVVF